MLIPFGTIALPFTGAMVVAQMCRAINAIADRQAGGLPVAAVVASHSGWSR